MHAAFLLSDEAGHSLVALLSLRVGYDEDENHV